MSDENVHVWPQDSQPLLEAYERRNLRRGGRVTWETLFQAAIQGGSAVSVRANDVIVSDACYIADLAWHRIQQERERMAAVSAAGEKQPGEEQAPLLRHAAGLLQEQRNEWRAKADELSQALQVANEDLQSQRETTARLEKEYEAADEKISEQYETIGELKERLKWAESARAELKKALDAANERPLAVELAECREQRDSATKRLGEERTERERTCAERDELQEECSRLQENLKQCQADLVAARQGNAKLIDQLEAMTKERDKRTEQIQKIYAVLNLRMRA